MIWRFTLIEPDGTESVIDEPVGWDALSMVLIRDNEWHGIAPQFSTSNLQFGDLGYWILKDEYESAGIDGNIGIRIEWGCDDCECYKLFFEGKIDFASYDENCGDECYINAGIEDDSPLTQLKNRGDTDVDLTSNIAYDGTTTLTDYAGLNKEIEIPSKAILLTANATTKNDEGDEDYNILTDFDYETFLDYSTSHGFNQGVILPKLNNLSATELNDFTPPFEFDYIEEADKLTNTDIISINNDTGLVLTNNYNVSLRFKGSLYFHYSATAGGGVGDPGGASVRVQLGTSLKYGPLNTDAFTPVVFENYIHGIVGGTDEEHTINFDFSWSGIISLAPLDKVYAFLDYIDTQTQESSPFAPIDTMRISMDEESFFHIDVASIVEPTPCKTYLLHEAASRVIENITNNALKFKSEYFGRTDSEPFAFDADGCGGLRTLTNGLQLRQAVLADNSNPKVFTNWQNILASLNALDHIGFDIEKIPNTDPDFPNTNVVRCEPVSFFYKPDVVFVADGVNAYSKKIKTDRIWNQFSFGFEKYETESTNGLDAIHTKRQYRIPIQNTDTTLEKLCKYIADGYAIEVTRRLFGTTQDWRYDQDIFMLCLTRLTELIVEQGNIDFAENLFDPATVINYRLSPIRNAMRWYNWLMQGKRPRDPDLTKMLFNSGEGNYVAKGKLQGATCFNEANAIAENDPLFENQFADPDAAKPFIVPEEVNWNFPLGLNEFLFLKENMYGAIQYRRDVNDRWQLGWITKLEPHHEDGDATFTLVTGPGILPVDVENYILTESGIVLETEDGIGLTEG